MKELRDVQTHRRHRKNVSSITASTSAGSTSWCDMVIGTTNPAFAPISTIAPPGRLTSPDIQPHHRGFGIIEVDERTAENTSSQMNQVLSAMNSLPTILQRDFTHTTVLHTQLPNFRGSKDKFTDFEHLLLNHLRPHQHRMTEENKLHYFQSLLRDEAIEFWQTLRINSKTTLRDVLLQFRQKFAREDFKEVSK